MRKLSLALLVFAVALAFGSAPEDSRVLVDKARAQAAKEDKNVLITFHASW